MSTLRVSESVLEERWTLEDDTVMPSYLTFSDVEEWYLRAKENLHAARARGNGIEEATESFLAAQSALGCLLEEIWPGAD